MATVGTSHLTLADWASRTHNGSVQSIVPLLEQTNDILLDQVWVEGNMETGHKTTVASGLPSVAWRLLNYGVAQSKSVTTQVTDTCGMLETYSKVDKDLARMNGMKAEFMLSESRPFIEAMNQEMASTLFYGNTATDPEKFLGLAPRYSSTSAGNGENIIDGSGTGSDNTSIWLIVWGPNTCFGIFPKGHPTGLQMEMLGEDTFTDAAGGEYQGYRTHFKWDAGLCVRDWRYVVRIANLDVSDLSITEATGAKLTDLMVQATEQIRNLNLGTPVFYCNKTIRSMLRRQITRRANVNLTFENVAGKRVLEFDGIPVRRCDALLNTEAAVS